VAGELSCFEDEYSRVGSEVLTAVVMMSYCLLGYDASPLTFRINIASILLAEFDPEDGGDMFFRNVG
jgi:hypothetical protein